MANQDSDNTLLAARNAQARPYGPGTQILVIGIHGTENTPSNVANVTNTIASGLQSTTNGPVLVNSSFDWRARAEVVSTPEGSAIVPVLGTAHLRNGTFDRNIASKEFAKHVLENVDYAYERGGFSKDKPLVINVAGFSHGGNVAILAIDEIAAGLKKRGLNEDAGIHLTTMSTPAYNGRRSQENPNGTARSAANSNGISFVHTAFAVPGDGVIKAAWGSDTYTVNNNSRSTRNYPINPAQNGIQHTITNHGLAQDDANVMNGIANIMANRFRGLAPANTRVSDNSFEDRQIIASASANGVSGVSQEKRANPLDAALASAKIEVTAKDFGDRANHFTSALAATNGNTNVAAALVQSGAEARFDPNGNFKVLQSTNGNGLIASQDSGQIVLRGDSVDPNKVTQPAQAVAIALNNQTSPQQVATISEDTLAQGVRNRSA
jgi:hypothetical protein